MNNAHNALCSMLSTIQLNRHWSHNNPENEGIALMNIRYYNTMIWLMSIEAS